ncbi:hypothetical protein ACFLYX_04415 [Chloroflexota bacterium]
MDINDERIRQAVQYTEILRTPKQSLQTFGTTNIYYYLVTEPAYAEMLGTVTETVIREGRVIAERPKIVTPYYLSNVSGFSSEAISYFEDLIREHGAYIRGVFYAYRNEPKDLTIVSNSLPSVVEKINAELDQKGEPMAAIIKGQDELWDVSLMKFIYGLAGSSVEDNLRQMGRRGLLNIDSAGIPSDARARIEGLFKKVARGEIEPGELKDELDRWGVFGEYEDRFLGLFRKRR